jgi:hypothetical protein
MKSILKSIRKNVLWNFWGSGFRKIIKIEKKNISLLIIKGEVWKYPKNGITN